MKEPDCSPRPHSPEQPYRDTQTSLKGLLETIAFSIKATCMTRRNIVLGRCHEDHLIEVTENKDILHIHLVKRQLQNCITC